MGNKKNLFTLAYAKKFLNKKGLELFKKSNQTRSSNSFKSLSYTVLSSLILIIIFFSSPIINNFKNNLITQSTEVTNNSKNKLENISSLKPNSEVKTILHIPLVSFLKTMAKDTNPEHLSIKEMYTLTFEKYNIWGASARILKQIFMLFSEKKLL